MTQAEGTLRRNPFSPAAVARVLDLDDHSGGAELVTIELVTIETQALRETLRYLDGYLRPGPREEAAGKDSASGDTGGAVLAIVGDYGTGKTHLVTQLLRRARQVREQGALVVHPVYLEASVGTFEKLYRAFVSKISRAELTETIRDYYADVVARALAAAEFTQGTAQRLRDRELDPDSVIEGLGLVDSRLEEELRRELIDITEKPEFGTALTMLLRRPEFAEDVWEWLTGHPPSPALAERGIATAITGEDMALEAMGVFAHVFGRPNHRFVLVIDELDKLLSIPPPPGPHPAGTAFQKLFEVFTAAGAFLVVVGLPDLFEVLGTGESQRIGHRVEMSALDGEDVRRLIVATHRQVLGSATLDPFGPTTPDLIAKLANGTVRQVIRLCHLSYRLAIQESAGQITGDIVRRAARSPDDPPTLRTVLGQLRRHLTALGLSPQPDFWLPDAARKINFWITVGTRRAGCAVIVAPSVVTEADAGPLVAQARDIRARIDGSQTILVVVGFLNRDLYDQLKDAFATPLLEHGRYEFTADLTTEVNAALSRIERDEGEDIETRVLERLTWMNQQQAYTHESIEKLTGRIEELRTALAAGGSAPAPPRVTATAAEVPPLPAPVAEAFEDALGVLADFSATESAIRGTLSAGTGAAAREEHERALRRWLSTPGLYPVTGMISLLRQLVEAFRSGVADWFARREATRADPAGTRQAAETRETLGQDLAALCQSYEAIYYHLPLPRLNEYLDVLTQGRVHDPAEEAIWAARREAVPVRLDDLGRRVQQAASQELSAAQGTAAGA